jgi:hypothetical protein
MKAYDARGTARHYAGMIEKANPPIRRVGMFWAICFVLTAIASGIVVGWMARMVWG